MWTKIAHFIIKYRIALIIILAAITGFMGYTGRTIEPTFKFASLVAKTDPDQIKFTNFKKTFGEDANSFAIGFDGKGIYELNNFSIYNELVHKISGIEGLDTVIGLPNIPRLVVNKRKKKFTLEPIFSPFPSTQIELNKKIDYVRKLKIYENQLFEEKTGAKFY